MSQLDVLYTVYTDGACSGNPGPGGWAWALAPDGASYASGPAPATTNQRMELTAAYEAAKAFKSRVEIVSDSTYVVNCFRDGWWQGWLKRGWRNSKREPVANRDLWEPFIDEYRSRSGEITFRWVKGHSNEPLNDLVDQLAVAAGKSQRSASAGVGVRSMEDAERRLGALNDENFAQSDAAISNGSPDQGALF